MTHLVCHGLSSFARRAIALSILAMATCAVGCSGSVPSEPKPERERGGEVQATPTTSSKPAQAKKKIEFIVFSAKWRSVCREVPAVLEGLRTAFPTVTFRELDIDDKENEKLWLEYGSDAVPYNHILVDGKVVAKFRGYLPPADAEKFVRDTLKGLESKQ